MEKRVPYVGAGKLEKWGFGRKTTRSGKKLPRGIREILGQIFLMVTAV